MTSDRERLKVTSKPLKLRVESEPYVVFLGRKFSTAIDVYDVKTRREYYLIIEAQSLSMPLKHLIDVEGGLRELVIWINKESDDKRAKYEIELA